MRSFSFFLKKCKHDFKCIYSLSDVDMVASNTISDFAVDNLIYIKDGDKDGEGVSVYFALANFYCAYIIVTDSCIDKHTFPKNTEEEEEEEEEEEDSYEEMDYGEEEDEGLFDEDGNEGGNWPLMYGNEHFI